MFVVPTCAPAKRDHLRQLRPSEPDQRHPAGAVDGIGPPRPLAIVMAKYPRYPHIFRLNGGAENERSFVSNWPVADSLVMSERPCKAADAPQCWCGPSFPSGRTRAHVCRPDRAREEVRRSSALQAVKRALFPWRFRPPRTRPNLPQNSGGRDRRSVMATVAISFTFAKLTRPAS